MTIFGQSDVSMYVPRPETERMRSSNPATSRILSALHSSDDNLQGLALQIIEC